MQPSQWLHLRCIAIGVALAFATGCAFVPPNTGDDNGNVSDDGTVDACETVDCDAGYDCDSDTGQCVLADDCAADRDCDDEVWCNGRELCVFGECLDGSAPCEEGLACDEIGETCHDGGPGPTGKTLTLVVGDGVTIELVRIAAGSFLMGTSATDHAALGRSQPAHGVTIGTDFYIGTFEVTQAQWLAVMGNNPSEFTGHTNLPVENVSWDEVVEFCEVLGTTTGYDIRLPSEAEWEYACRAGSSSAYFFGSDVADLVERAWYTANSESTTHEIGGKLPNLWGLYDVHGNVLEWCQDPWHEDYNGAPSDERVWTTDGDPSLRVLRGGAWYGADFHLRSAYRAGYSSDDRFRGIGFRVAAGT